MLESIFSPPALVFFSLDIWSSIDVKHIVVFSVKTEDEDVEMKDVQQKLSKPIKQVPVTKEIIEEVTCGSLLSSHLSVSVVRVLCCPKPSHPPFERKTRK